MKNIKTINLLLLAIAMIFSANIANADEESDLNDFLSSPTDAEHTIGGDITLSGNLNAVSATIQKTIYGGNHTITGKNGASNYKGFVFNSGANVTIQNLILKEMKSASSGGGAIRNDADATISQLTADFFGNYTTDSASSGGGAIYNEGEITKITGSKFEWNGYSDYNGTKGTTPSTINGGAISNYTNSILYPTIEISDTSFSNNVATQKGGAIYNEDTSAGTATITISGNTTFTNNIATQKGGAIYNDSQISQLTANFIGNYTTSTNEGEGLGGAIYNSDTITKISDSTFEGNGYSDYNGTKGTTPSTLKGGAIYNTDTIKISNTSFTNNVAKEAGGAIYNSGTIDEILGKKFEGNKITNGDGGAIYNEGEISKLTANFKSNTATSGTGRGGAIYNSGKLYEISGTKFEGNSALDGGAIYNNAGAETIEIINATFSGNTVDDCGGAIFNKNGLVIIENSTFSNNVATFPGFGDSSGGAIYNESGTITLNGTNIFKDNYASVKQNDINNKLSCTLNIENGTTTIYGGITGNGTTNINSSGTLILQHNATGLATLEQMLVNINDGTLSLQNSETTSHIDSLTISTIGSESQDKIANFALDYSGSENTIDNIIINNLYSNYPKVKVSNIYISTDATSTGVKEVTWLADNSGSLTDKTDSFSTYTSLYKYIFTKNGKGVLGVEVKTNTQTLEEAIADATAISFSVTTSKYEVSSNLGNLAGAGRNFTIYGNKKTIDGNGYEGINIASGQTFTLNHGTMNNFEKSTGDGGAINNAGTTKIIYGEFNNNTAQNGGAIYSTGTLSMTGEPVRFVNNHATENGGAIYNNGGTKSVPAEIDSSLFIGNYTGTSGLGGAVYNETDKYINLTYSIFEGNGYSDYDFSAHKGTTSSTTSGGAIFNNGTNSIYYVKFINNTAKESGGAIYNDTNGTIDISGEKNLFKGNTAPIGGGAITNYGTLNLTGANTFTCNSAEFGGAITNGNTINTISGASFYGNKATNDSGMTTSGGAIYNEENGTITTITDSYFEGNGYSDYNEITHQGTTSSTEKGGAIYNIGTINEILNTTFKDNITSEDGGAIFNDMVYPTPIGTINKISGSTFKNNKSKNCGAIFNSGTINEISNTIFEDNTASEYGGAIGNLGTITLKGTNIFTGNKVNGKPNDIYNESTLNIEDGTTTMDGGISNYNGYWGLTNIQNGGTLKLSGNATFEQSMVNFNSGTLDIANGVINNLSYQILGFTGTNNNIYVDADLANKTMDTLNTNYVTGTGSLHVKGINLLTEAKNDKTSINFTSSSSLKNKVDYTGKQGIQKATSPIFNYNVAYDKNTGNFQFTRDGCNPTVLSAGVAAQVGAYLTQLQSYNEAFANMDSTMLMTFEQRMAMKYANKYASLNPEEKFSFSPNQIPEQSKGLWVNPYTSFERVNLNNGPSVDAITYGSLFGGDSGLIELKHGWDMVLGAYVGYNGSNLHYDNVTVVNNGGTLGFNSVFYKGNFFTGLTANVGASGAEASTPYGNDAFAMLSTGVASKTGYNWELFNSKLIIQPSFLMSYTFVNTFDYTNSQGVGISSDPLHAIQLAPGVKFIGNLPHGWQPYIGVQMIWNLMDKSKCYANDVALPEISTDPYVQYGIGVQKRWGERFTGFGQVMVRNGGRNGVALSAGFRWALGKDSKTSSAKSNKTSELIKNRKSHVNLSLR